MALVNGDNSANLQIILPSAVNTPLGVETVRNASVLVYDASTVTAHTVTSISPDFMTYDQDGVVVSVVGTGFVSGMTVDVGPELTAIVTFNSSTSLSVTINTTGAPVAGARPFLVVNPATGLAISAQDQSWTVNLPTQATITSFTPSTMPMNTDGFVVSVVGTDFTTGMTCDIDPSLSAVVVFNSPTSLTVTVSTPGAGVAGSFPFSLTDTFGRTSFDDDVAFTVGLPTQAVITNITPDDMLLQTGGNIISVTGTNFTTGMTCFIHASLSASVTFNNSTSLTVNVTTVGLGVEGCFPFTLTDTFGRVSSAVNQAFAVHKTAVPTITSVTPSTVVLGESPWTIEVVGTNFAPGTEFVNNADFEANFTTFNSPTSLTVELFPLTPLAPATSTFSVAEGAYGQVGTWPGVFESVFPAAPTITLISPAFMMIDTNDNIISVTGTGFVPGMTCDLGPNLATTFTYISPTSATVEVDTITPVSEARTFSLVEPVFGQKATWEDGAFAVVQPTFGFGDPPTVSDVFPAPGTSIRKNQPLSFFVGDVDDNGLAEFITMSFPGLVPEEVVWDASSFTSLYSNSSRTSSGNGHDYVIRRTGGWPAAPSLRIFAIDTNGNIL